MLKNGDIGVKTAVAFIMLFIVACFTLMALGYRTQRQQFDFLCQTTVSMTQIWDRAANQIQANFDNGTYDRSRKKGIATDETIKAARATLESYREQARLLQEKSPCDKSPLK